MKLPTPSTQTVLRVLSTVWAYARRWPRRTVVLAAAAAVMVVSAVVVVAAAAQDDPPTVTCPRPTVTLNPLGASTEAVIAWEGTGVTAYDWHLRTAGLTVPGYETVSTTGSPARQLLPAAAAGKILQVILSCGDTDSDARSLWLPDAVHAAAKITELEATIDALTARVAALEDAPAAAVDWSTPFDCINESHEQVYEVATGADGISRAWEHHDTPWRMSGGRPSEVPGRHDMFIRCTDGPDLNIHVDPDHRRSRPLGTCHSLVDAVAVIHYRDGDYPGGAATVNAAWMDTAFPDGWCAAGRVRSRPEQTPTDGGLYVASDMHGYYELWDGSTVPRLGTLN